MIQARWRGVATFLLAALTGLFARSPAQAACNLNTIAELPVTMSGPRALIAAKINGADVVFIADSGAFYSTISPGNAAALHLPLSPSPIANVFGIGGQAAISVGTVRTLTLAGADIHNVEFIVGGSEMSAEAVGLLGQNVLHLADVEYDLGDSMIRLMAPHGCERADLAYWAHGKPDSMAPIDWSDFAHPHTVATALLNGVRIRVTFDTGAAASVLSLGAARRAGIKTDGPGVEPMGLSGGLGRNLVQIWSAPIKTFEIGGEKIENTRLLIGDLGAVDTDMLLGADFFLSHRVFVSNSQRRLYFTYEGGPVFNLTPKLVVADADGKAIAPTSPATPAGGSGTQGLEGGRGEGAADGSTAAKAPTDADGFSRRGAYFASRREYDKAAGDLTKARDLAPENAQYDYQLAMVHIAAGQPGRAKVDLDTAIKLKPADAEALIARAHLRHADHDSSGEVADLDAASHALSQPAHLRLALAELYVDGDQYERAITEFNDWIAAHPDDSRRPFALNGRCWARALLGRELDRALSDCNGAIWLMPRAANFIDTRGLVRLRRGEFNRAIGDYDAALKLNPKIAWSLYGRGLAELKTGDAAKGRADIAAATVIDPKLPDRASKLGLIPVAFAAAATPTVSAAASGERRSVTAASAN